MAYTNQVWQSFVCKINFVGVTWQDIVICLHCCNINLALLSYKIRFWCHINLALLLYTCDFGVLYTWFCCHINLVLLLI